MVLVTYPDSGTESEPERSIPHKKSVGNTPTSYVSATYSRSRPPKRKADELLDASNTPRPILPPLPKSVHSLYATNVRTGTSDDPSLHGGRKRQVVHTQGNWPSHVYLEWYPNKFQLHRLDTVITNTQAVLNGTHTNTQHGSSHVTDPPQTNALTLHSFLRSPLSAQMPLHVSLSAPLVLRTSNKDFFHAELSKVVTAAQIGPIDVQLTSLDMVPNFERSRYFLVARLDSRSRGKLSELLEICNGVCERFGVPRLYQSQNRDAEGEDEAVGVQIKPGIVNEQAADTNTGDDANEVTMEVRDHQNAFHVSIAWMLAEVADTVRREIQLATLQGVEEDTIRFEQVKIKIGNIVDDVLL